ncbi:MAG: glycosyl transferase family protein [Candidatus Peregrinibacteria bacterium GW2011_GWF2_43_17]|nr:MAG: glycosyl transferase family protein [Candidatus Peregrinibacteria bacterium GW2011_GWF2_43_17]HAU40043.1 hypothetical protein [Candidatus Peregrinibacteria bacterium]
MKSFRNKNSLLAVVLIGYNSLKFLASCIESIKKQTLFKKDLLDIIFIDNLSHDDSAKFVLENYPFVRVYQNHFNFGYAGAANQGIDLTSAPYVNIINPDIILEKDFYEKIIKAISQNKAISSATGKLLKYDFEANKKTNIIDSTGLLFHATTIITDRGQGEIDKKQYDKSHEVWGVSGACPIYRRDALLKIKNGDDFFDSRFFMYKEDTDLAWRFNKQGLRAIYVPSAVAYHGRGTGVETGFFNKRKALSRFQRIYSFRNHQLMLKKNLTLKDFAKHPLAITAFETASVINAIREGVFFKSFKI